MFSMTPKTRNFDRNAPFWAPRRIFPALPGAARYALASYIHGAKHSPFLTFCSWPEAGSRGGAEHKWFSGTFRKLWCIQCWFWKVGLVSSIQFGSGFRFVLPHPKSVEYLSVPSHILIFLWFRMLENLKKSEFRKFWNWWYFQPCSCRQFPYGMKISKILGAKIDVLHDPENSKFWSERPILST